MPRNASRPAVCLWRTSINVLLIGTQIGSVSLYAAPFSPASSVPSSAPKPAITEVVPPQLRAALARARLRLNLAVDAAVSSLSRNREFSRLLFQFEEPLVPTGPTSAEEDNALLEVLKSYQSQKDSIAALDEFLAAHPRSAWRVALLTNLGLSYYSDGYFSKAISSWEEAWREGKPVTEPRARALVDRAVGELARMHARLGQAERLAALFNEIGDRPVTGPATEALTGAREGLWMVQNEPGVAYLCGPTALKNLLLSQGAPSDDLRFLDDYRSGPNGVSLAEVAALADRAKLPYWLVFRKPGQPIPVPSIVHWKLTVRDSFSP